jgi:hypothetical protein
VIRPEFDVSVKSVGFDVAKLMIMISVSSELSLEVDKVVIRPEGCLSVSRSRDTLEQGS